MAKDEIFRRKRRVITDFNFRKETAKVLDDMLNRSVPFYDEMQRMTAEMAVDFAVGGTNLYDLGCSTGTTLLVMDKLLSKGVTFVGIDYSADMLAEARQKLKISAAVWCAT